MMRRKMNFVVLYALYLALFTLNLPLLSCTSSSTSSSAFGTIIAHVVWPGEPLAQRAAGDVKIAPADCSTMRVIVSGPGMSDIQADFAAPAGDTTIDGVPAGSDRVVTLKGMNASGAVIYTGVSNSVSVSAGGTSLTAPVVMAREARITKLPDTGQTTKYSAESADDSDYVLDPPSYTDNGNGTVTDNVTGLVWQ